MSCRRQPPPPTGKQDAPKKGPPPGGGSRVSGWGSARDKGRFARWGNSFGCRTQGWVGSIQNKYYLPSCALSPCRLSAPPPSRRGAFGRATQSYFFHSAIWFPPPSFSFEQVGTKEKEAKRKCQKENALRGLFEKSPLKIPEKLSNTVAGMFGDITHSVLAALRWRTLRSFRTIRGRKFPPPALLWATGSRRSCPAGCLPPKNAALLPRPL